MRKVLLRGFGLKPTILDYVGPCHDSPNHIDITGGTSVMAWRLEDAFEPDDAVFESLRAAYEAGNQVELERLWSEAKPFVVERAVTP